MFMPYLGSVVLFLASQSEAVQASRRLGKYVTKPHPETVSPGPHKEKLCGSNVGNSESYH